MPSNVIGPEAVVGEFTIGETVTSDAPLTGATVDVSIRAEVLNGVWETFGVERDVEVDPETVTYSANEWGCEKASFVLKRNPWASWPDLSPFTPIEIEIGGVIVWIGRIEGTPLKAGAEAQISVQCGGWQYHLDDDLSRRVYVHALLTDWKDIRSSDETQLAVVQAAPQVQVEAGAITLSFPKGTTVVTNEAVCVVLDLGEAAAKAIAIEGTNVTKGIVSTVTEEGYKLYVRSVPRIFQVFGPGGYEEMGAAMDAKAEGVYEGEGYIAGTPHIAVATTPYRYVAIFLYRSGASTTPTVDQSVRISAIRVFSEEVYESAGSSVLKASTVIESALPFAPLLSKDLSQIDIAADEFAIPSLVLPSPQTPRQIAEAVNTFHLWVLAVDLERRVVFVPPTDEPEWEVGAWSGERIEDASAGEAADIYDAVIVTGTAANGEALTVTVTAAELGASTIMGERGFTRAKTISLSNATDETVMRQIGTVWLEEQLEVPFGGAITAPVGAIRAVLGGAPQHPSLVCRHVNQLLRVSHAIDPSDGGVGRDGRIVSASYSHVEQMATITLGARTSSVEALLARLAVVAEAGS